MTVRVLKQSNEGLQSENDELKDELALVKGRLLDLEVELAKVKEENTRLNQRYFLCFSVSTASPLTTINIPTTRDSFLPLKT